MINTYEILKEDSIIYDDHTLCRIRSLINLDGIKIGDLGGYIENTKNLNDYCWIDKNSKVYGNSNISDRSAIIKNSIIKDTIIDGNLWKINTSSINNCILSYSGVIINSSINGSNTNIFINLNTDIIDTYISCNGTLILSDCPYIKNSTIIIDDNKSIKINEKIHLIDAYIKKQTDFIIFKNIITEFNELQQVSNYQYSCYKNKENKISVSGVFKNKSDIISIEDILNDSNFINKPKNKIWKPLLEAAKIQLQ